jgi:hypothetical protein
VSASSNGSKMPKANSPTREARSGDPYLLRKAREMNRALDCEPDEWIWEEYPHESA